MNDWKSKIFSKTVMAWAAAIVLLLAAAILGASQLKSPQVLPADAPQNCFSAGRALEHVRVIARAPHPMGSPENERVAEYVLSQLNSLGLETDLQYSTAVVQNASPPYITGQVTNILARLKGSRPGNAVLLSAHYDSYPTSPGAGDNGAGVAALLETVRALRSGHRLKNDIIFLFNDGEEMGLLGATAFMAEHPWRESVKLAVNLDSRGSRGPSIMFETGDSNGGLMKEYLKASSYPLAYSYSYEVYRMMLNITDFTVFRGAGLTGFNFAFIGAGHTYDNAFNTIENLSLASLQHHGLNVLELSRYFGEAELGGIKKESNAVYFNIAPKIVFCYSRTLAELLAILGTVLLGVLIYFGIKKDKFSVGQMLRSSLVPMLALVSVATATFLVWLPIKSLLQQDLRISWDNWYGAGFMFLAATLILFLQHTLLKKYRNINVLLGNIIFWWVITLVSTVLVPGASYLFLWPLLGAVFGLGVWLFYKGENYLVRIVPLAFIMVPLIILFVPALYLIYIGISLDMAAELMGIASLPLTMFLSVLFLCRSGGRKKTVLVLLVTATAVFGTRSLMIASGLNRPAQDTMIYCLDADQNRAVWASIDPKPDVFTRQFLGDDHIRGPIGDYLPGMGERPFLINQAPLKPLPPPLVQVLDDSSSGGLRCLRLKISSPRLGETITLEFDPQAEIMQAAMNGKHIKLSPENGPALRWLFINYALPAGGIILDLTVKGVGELSLTVMDQSNGLPEIPGLKYEKRPGYITPGPIGIRDGTFVSKKIRL